MKDEADLDGLLDRLLGVKPDDVVLHGRVLGETATRAKITLRAPQEHAGDLKLLRTRR